MGRAELQLGQRLIACAGLADAQAAGSRHFQFGVLVAVLRVFHQILLADVDLGNIGQFALLDLGGHTLETLVRAFLLRRGGLCLRRGAQVVSKIHLHQDLFNNCS